MTGVARAAVGLEGKARGSESGKVGSKSIATLLRGVLAGEELGNARGELPGAKSGVRGARRGVLMPSARLAGIPLIGVTETLLAYLCRAGVPAAEGVPGRKRRWGGGAMDSD